MLIASKLIHSQWRAFNNIDDTIRLLSTILRTLKATAAVHNIA
jgi:hypothetical protein